MHTAPSGMSNAHGTPVTGSGTTRTAPGPTTGATATAEPGDVVVVAGKGHEQGQEFENGRKEPFDDVSEARSALRARLGARA